jgi:hypothetical protein
MTDTASYTLRGNYDLARRWHVATTPLADFVGYCEIPSIRRHVDSSGTPVMKPASAEAGIFCQFEGVGWLLELAGLDPNCWRKFGNGSGYPTMAALY